MLMKPGQTDDTNEGSFIAPLVSVIIPHRNHAEYIEERFQSVIQQSYQRFEIILLDDASDDGSLTLLKELAKHEKVSHFVVNNICSGSAFRQWKKGIDLAKGEFIWIAESDDSVEPEFLSTMLDRLIKNEKLALTYCQSWDISAEGEKIENREYWTSNFRPNIWEHDFEMNGRAFVSKYLGVKNVLPNASAVVFRKSAIDPSSWDVILDMHFVGDWFFWCKMLLRGDISFVRTPFNYFRAHGATTRMQNSFGQELRRLDENIELRLWLKGAVDDNQRFKHKGLKRRLKALIIKEIKHGSPFQVIRAGSYRTILKLVKLRYL